MRRAWIVGLAVTCLAMVSCSNDETVMGTPSCSDDLVLVAQSVPDAEFVPCFEELPGGWTVSHTSVGQDGLTMKLDSDRAGSNAAIFTYGQDCDVSEVGQLPSEQEDVAVHEEIGRLAGGLESRRFYLFEGGCVTVNLDFDEFDDISHAERLLQSMVLVRRQELNESLQQENDLFGV